MALAAGYADGTAVEALYWRRIYAELVLVHENARENMRHLAADMSTSERHEVEAIDLALLTTHIARFQERHAHWEARLRKAASPRIG